MIRSFRHKGLKKFYASGSTAGIQPKHAQRLRMLLASLEAASGLPDLTNGTFDLHRLKGQSNGRWSVRVNKNWRLTFSIVNHAFDELDYEDYH